ncbi:PRTRC system protein E [Acidovorax sp. SDU_ACID1]|uniref:PRTRC system protein E n=1 Tax=Acidovorax sp. SDU_ACID1 TaxID=3136632 RepID=UPI0038735D33
MTMFEELYALALNATLTMTVSADEKSGRLTVNVIPKPRADAAEPALAQPLSLTATPQEFDTGFIDALCGYRETRQSLAQQVEATKEVIEAAKAASVKKASEATAKASAAKVAPKPAPAASSPAPALASTDDDDDGGDTPASGFVAAPAAASGDSFDLFG